MAVYRGMLGAEIAKRDTVRPEVLSFLIDNMLIDQYLDGQKITVDAKEVADQVAKLKTEIDATGRTVDDFCKSLFLTEADLRTQIAATTRWDKFVAKYSSDKQLRDFFEANKAFFDGSMCHCRHILLAFAPDNAPAAEQAKIRAMQLKKQIEEKVAKGLAADAGKLDNLEMQKKRLQLLETSFSDTATMESACDTKVNGGDLGMFPRGGGKVVEPFARVAFALKPGEMSDPVLTEFGYHLILCVGTKAGVERKFEDVKDAVKDVFSDRMREVVVKSMRPNAKIVVNPAPSK
jgi:peptidyl-prolyl cis-trans isomerase C